ncbi:MAG: hypothetical protein U0S49_12300 [Rhodospirillales bacterium]|nr:hypothetical protein [Rhodospirillales bacterium]
MTKTRPSPLALVPRAAPQHDDRLYGKVGNDVLYGGPGNDTHWGEDGNDFIR